MTPRFNYTLRLKGNSKSATPKISNFIKKKSLLQRLQKQMNNILTERLNTNLLIDLF